MKKHKKEVKILPMDTELRKFNLIFNNVCIYRDLPRCDHMILFKNLFMHHELRHLSKKLFPIQTFYKYIKKRKCDICKFKHVTVVTRKDKISSKLLNFLCKNCFGDLHLDEKGNLKNEGFELFPYEYE